MIERYCTKEMSKLWSEKEKYKKWIFIEMVVNDTLQQESIISKNKLHEKFDNLLKNKTLLNKLVKLSKSLEDHTKHDVNAFVFALEKILGKEGRWVHYGLTSYDVVDTANALSIQMSIRLINEELCNLIKIINNKKEENKNILIMGRTHGMYAQPIYLYKIFEWWLENLFYTPHTIPGKISGVVGDNKYISHDIEKKILNKLNLEAAHCSSQVVSRRHYSYLVHSLALLGCALENIALQIRLYQQSGIEEMYEPFEKRQTGSSAMPHKRNPILCENICGLAKILRSYVPVFMENISLWHQRDLSHSCTERIILPDIFNLLHFMIKRMSHVIENLEINYNNINKNLKKESFKVDSQEKLLKLIQQGKSRQSAYTMIQKGFKK